MQHLCLRFKKWCNKVQYSEGFQYFQTPCHESRLERRKNMELWEVRLSFFHYYCACWVWLISSDYIVAAVFKWLFLHQVLDGHIIQTLAKFDAFKVSCGRPLKCKWANVAPGRSSWIIRNRLQNFLDILDSDYPDMKGTTLVTFPDWRDISLLGLTFQHEPHFVLFRFLTLWN